MEKKFVYIAFKSNDYSEVLYVGNDYDDVIAQICANKELGITEEQKQQLKDNVFFDDNGECGTYTFDSEFSVTRFRMNCFA